MSTLSAPPQILTLDFGNTQLKHGTFAAGDSHATSYGAIDLHDEQGIAGLLKPGSYAHIIYSQVLDLHENWYKRMEEATTGRCVRFSRELPLPVSIAYSTPETLGTDRLANSCAAAWLYPQKRVLTIDCGTCLKCDLTSKNAEYLGGSISPGLEMRFRAMHNFTARLPLARSDGSADFPGTSTLDAMRTGVLRGMQYEIAGFIHDSKAEIVLITGGDAKYFEKALKNNIFALPYLTLQGLNAGFQSYVAG